MLKVFWSGFNSSGGWESVCCGRFPDVCELWSAVSHVRPVLDVSDGALLFQHSVTADGRPGAWPDHPANAHASTYRSVPPYLAFFLQCNAHVLTFSSFSFSSPQDFSFFSAGCFSPINILVRSGMTSLDLDCPIGWEWWVGVCYWLCCL